MSRRRGEFEHRTSIFEGAFRAWSHLGGLDPLDVESRPASELDPLTNPIEHDTRLGGKRSGATNPDGSHRREYPYEPLPRAGLAHPYVQAILSPWLGPDADNEAIQLGLTTLRTWWQHRRKGESGSAIAALGTEKMKGVVEGYTRHFFTLSHCLIVNDKEQPPRSLHQKMKDLDKVRKKGTKKRTRDDQLGSIASMGLQPVGDDLVASLQADLTDTTLSPLERLHAAQRRQLAESGGLQTTQPIIPISGKCVPGKVDLPGIVDAVTRHATQLAHRGGGGGMVGSVASSDASLSAPAALEPNNQYGDPNTTPVVFVSGNGDIQIAMTVEGITCAHCVKIVETVLKGCNGNKSPIDGLLDAAADRVLCSVLIKIDQASNSKRIAFEAARNLAMVGYTAKAKEMSIVGAGADRKSTMDLGSLSTAFEVVANTDPKDFFDWTLSCTCPDNGVLRDDCARYVRRSMDGGWSDTRPCFELLGTHPVFPLLHSHSQMNTGIFDAFSTREAQVTDHMAGCGMKFGMNCTCGPDCRCKNCPTHSNRGSSSAPGPHASNVTILPGKMDPLIEDPIHIDQHMEFTFGMEPPSVPAPPPPTIAKNDSALSDGTPTTIQFSIEAGQAFASRRQSRNPSILSYGNGLRNMSLASDATFGRAMSGLSALSIDWENLEDFDLEVDHSAHINNSPMRNMDGGGRRRSSVRRSFISTTGDKGDNAHVSFKV